MSKMEVEHMMIESCHTAYYVTSKVKMQKKSDKIKANGGIIKRLVAQTMTGKLWIGDVWEKKF